MNWIKNHAEAVMITTIIWILISHMNIKFTSIEKDIELIKSLLMQITDKNRLNNDSSSSI